MPARVMTEALTRKTMKTGLGADSTASAFDPAFTRAQFQRSIAHDLEFGQTNGTPIQRAIQQGDSGMFGCMFRL